MILGRMLVGNWTYYTIFAFSLLINEWKILNEDVGYVNIPLHEKIWSSLPRKIEHKSIRVLISLFFILYFIGGYLFHGLSFPFILFAYVFLNDLVIFLGNGWLLFPMKCDIMVKFAPSNLKIVGSIPTSNSLGELKVFGSNLLSIGVRLCTA